MDLQTNRDDFARSAGRAALSLGWQLLSLVAFIVVIASLAYSQQTDAVSKPVIVQPGAPGQPTRTLPSTTRAKLPPVSKKDVEFMQGMILHHQQAVEMAALIEERTQNKDIRLLGARIRQSQTDEMNFMKLWLELRGESVPQLGDAAAHSHGMGNAGDHKMMPGMLTPIQMGALTRARGDAFDRLFLTGMIQHHRGALTMVKDLFDTPAAGQDAELFNFASDVDTGQRGEIKAMETLLERRP